MDKQQLAKLGTTHMPFGKYKGRKIIDLPEDYLLWFERKALFPQGELGQLMALALLIKTEGLEGLLRP